MFKRSPNAFSFRSLEELKNKVNKMGLKIPFKDDIKAGLSILKEQVTVNGKVIPNRFCIQPMEGCDGEPDGSPGELTFRRYKRFAAGGSGMLWIEATAVTPEGKANPRQLHINRESAPNFKRLADIIRENSRDEAGNSQRPFLVLQLTHSGRYSKPTGKPAPMIFYHSPILDPSHNLPADYPLATDQYLDELADKFVNAAKLAYECGYDAVDIKSCHGYLLHEILSSYTRTDSKYGGSFENRIRFLTQVVERIRKEVPELIVTTRLNVYDAYPYPYGFGMKKDGSMDFDLSEPVELIRRLRQLGVTMINVATGNPYYNPYIERPYDFPSQGIELPEEHPLVSVERNMVITGEVKKQFSSDMTFVSVGYTWLREYFHHLGSAMVEEGLTDIVGIGRLALANPNYANELFRNGKIEQEKTCITCSSCTQIMRDGGMSGCVIRDYEIYRPIYYRGRANNAQYMRNYADKCRNCWGAACVGGCPAGIDIPRFINVFYEGNTELAYNIIRENNILPETCAYTCPVEVLCQKSCTARLLDRQAVPIHELHGVIAVEARKNGWSKVKAQPHNGKKVAIIGFGPAGIACSVYLVERGYKVTVFEATDRIGGTATAAIPYERLPKSVLEEEVRAFALEETGLFEIKYNTPINEEFTLDDIMDQGFDACFIAAGLSENAGLDTNSKPEGVYQALDFLYQVKQGNIHVDSSTRAIVIGGGNTAMDAAFSLSQAGAGDVYLAYRRSFNQLPAWPKEVEHTLASGVHFMILNQPVEYVEENGKLAGIRLVHTELGPVDASGRRSPVTVENAQYVLPVSIAVEAVGQKLSGSLAKALKGVEIKNGRIRIASGRHMTTRKNVFAGGDIINGGQTVVQAIREGLDAAKEICDII